MNIYLKDRNIKINCPYEFFIHHILSVEYIFKSTYYENGELQCGYNRRRSISDILDIYKSYGFDINIRDLFILIKTKVNQYLQQNEQIMMFHFCNDINKWVFYILNKSNSESINNSFYHIDNLHKLDEKTKLRKGIDDISYFHLELMTKDNETKIF